MRHGFRFQSAQHVGALMLEVSGGEGQEGGGAGGRGDGGGGRMSHDVPLEAQTEVSADIST